MDPTLRSLLLARLAASDLDDDARAKVAAAAGPAIEGGDAGDQAGEVYLKSVTVEAFRGIGPAATLELNAHPGLTVVVGRNGSGKSSFAEGLELLMTGETKRWASKTKNWASAWQCLHTEQPTRIAAELVVAGEDTPLVFEQTWERGTSYSDTAGRADVTQLLGTRGWEEALTSFRPFLAYAELASMFDKLTSLYAALSPILGLEAVDELLAGISGERLGLENHAKQAKADAAALRGSLAEDDPREAALAELLGKAKPDLAAIKEHLAAHPHGTSSTDESSTALRKLARIDVPEDEELRAQFEAVQTAQLDVDAVAATDASRALATADLLTRALTFRDPTKLADDCPVCNSTSVLDEAWAIEAQSEALRLRDQAGELGAATSTRDVARRAWTSEVERLNASTEDERADPDDLDPVLAVAASVRETSTRARALLEEQDTVWKSRIDETSAWLAEAKRVQLEAHGLKALKAAEKWLKAEADTLRNERFAPIAKQAIANWELLKHESSVELRDITLRTVGRTRQADFDVRADGQDADALGVMSQGELLALAVSVFLPRAGLDESPFRFAVIDDPVQSMDPAKVDGLARVLANAAKTRQVVVFTHDDRLPEAIRRLKINAQVLQVNRRSASRVAVAESLTPVRRYLDEAKQMAKSKHVTEAVRQRVVPSLCRDAVEAACAELVRKRGVAAGLPASAVDAQLRDTRGLRSQLALTLLGDTKDHAGLAEALKDVHAVGPGVVFDVNRGAHGDYDGPPLELFERTRTFVYELMAAS